MGVHPDRRQPLMDLARAVLDTIRLETRDGAEQGWVEGVLFAVIFRSMPMRERTRLVATLTEIQRLARTSHLCVACGRPCDCLGGENDASHCETCGCHPSGKGAA